MVAVRVMEVATDQIVDVVAVRDFLVPAIGPMLMICLVLVAAVIRRADGRVALVDVHSVMLDRLTGVVVQLPFVEVVDVISVMDPGVPTAGPVLVRVAHGALPQVTIRISWLVLLSRRPPSSVTVTMSSMRTPNRPGRYTPGSIEKHIPGFSGRVSPSTM